MIGTKHVTVDRIVRSQVFISEWTADVIQHFYDHIMVKTALDVY